MSTARDTSGMPQQPPPGKALLISPEKASRLLALLDRFDLEPDPTQFQQYTRNGKVFFRYRPPAETPASGGGGGSHPFQIRVEAGELYVRWGMVNVMRVFSDVDDKPYPTPELCSTQINALALEGDPDGGTVGSLTVLDDEVYGVWLELTWAVVGPFDKTGITYGQFVTWDLVTYTVSPNIIISDVATAGSTASLMPTTAMKSYLFIGRVTLVAGVATIAQYLTSDVIIPGSIIPNQILSSENVDLFLGADDGIAYEEPPAPLPASIDPPTPFTAEVGWPKSFRKELTIAAIGCLPASDVVVAWADFDETYENSAETSNLNFAVIPGTDQFTLIITSSTSQGFGGDLALKYYLIV